MSPPRIRDAAIAANFAEMILPLGWSVSIMKCLAHGERPRSRMRIHCSSDFRQRKRSSSSQGLASGPSVGAAAANRFGGCPCGEVTGSVGRVDSGSRAAIPQALRAKRLAQGNATQGLLRKAQRTSTPRRIEEAPQGSPSRLPRLNSRRHEIPNQNQKLAAFLRPAARVRMSRSGFGASAEKSHGRKA